MTRLRIVFCLALVLGALVPYGGIAGGPRPALAAGVHSAWHIDKGQIDPGSGRSAITQTFTPTTATCLVEVVLAGSDAGDEIYMQLGDDQHDYTQVYSGEDRFFAVTHLHAGVMPAFRLIADPNHNYGGRTLNYAVQVIGIPSLPLNADGVAVSQVHNVLGLNVPSAGTYTIHYHLDGGTAHIQVASGAGQQDSGQLSGEGGFTVKLPVGVAGLALNPAPANGALHWSLAIGKAPAARDFQPK